MRNKSFLTLLALSVFVLGSFVSAANAAPLAQATLPRADAVVLVNSASASFGDFQHYTQPYLDNFGVPYTVIDIATDPVGGDIGDYAVIIVGHRQLDLADTLDATEEGYISAAVSAGTGLVNFDNDLSVGGTTPRYQFIQDIFDFGYLPPSTGAGVTFTSETGGGLQINCWDDAHQDPVLATFTNASLFNDTDGEWDEFLWLGHRDYPGVFGGIPEASDGTLGTFHCFGDVPNGTYDVIANLYHSRNWRYFWGYTAADPQTNSYDVTSGPSGDFAEFEIDTVTITDGSFDIYMNYGEDLGGTAFPYFGWSWIRLVPTSAPPPVMHYITERHTAGELITTGGMTMAGITLPAGVTALAMTGSQPFLAVTDFGAGRAVQWGSYNWMSHAVKGPIYGLDDLVWRSIVWAARKPFVMQGLPPFLTMRVDDESGPFGWIEIANEFDIKPWAGLFYHNVDATEAAQLSALVNSGNATAAVHAKTGAFFYYNHGVGDFPDAEIEANYAHATTWHADHNIPISKFVLPHFYEFGTNVFQGLSDWGVEFVGTMMVPGNGYGAPWIMNGPYRLFQTGGSSGGQPVYYADFMTIPDQPEFDGQFFNCVTEIRDDAGYEWYPSNDVAGSIGRGTRQTRRALDSMALATLFTHGYYTAGITPDNWRATLQGITDNLASYDPIYVTLDHACQYVRAMHTSDITESSYDPVSRQVTTFLGGETDMPTMFYLFIGQGGDIHHLLIDVPEFSGSAEVAYTLAGPLDHIVVTPASATVALGGAQQFTAQGYDADDNPIPNLPFTWSVVNGGGTIDSNGLFTAGVVAGSYANTVEASFGGVSGHASVEVVAPALDHFTFEAIASPQYVGAPFQVTIAARDISGNLLLGYSGPAALSDSTGTIDPAVTGSFSGGLWTGEVTINQAAHDVMVTASDGDATGTSEPFEVQDMPMFYQVTSPSYEHLAGDSFLVTVTAYEGTTINCWEDDHQDPVLATTTDPAPLETTPGEWTEFHYVSGGRPFPSVMAEHNEYEDYGLPLMRFYASGIPNGEYEVIANLYESAPMRYFYGFTPGDPFAHYVDTPGGAPGTQHREYSLGTVAITDGTFNLYVQDADILGGTYPIFGWAWVRLVPVEVEAGILIDCSEDDHQDPVLATTTSVPDLNETDGEWTEFLYTPSRPYPSVLAAVNEYEDYGLPVMRFYASGIPNGEYEVIANLYDNAAMRYFYGFTPGDPLAQYVDTPGGAPGTQHREYSLGTVAITDGTFNLYVQDANILGGTYPFYGWAWIRLVPAGLTMSSSSPTMLFDADGDGTFGEPGDDVKPLEGGTFDIMARDTTAGTDVTIVATDVLGRFGYNTYTILSVNQPPVANAGGPYTYINEGDSVTLDASGSSDPDDNIVLYEWDLDNDGEYDDATGVTTDVVFDDNGTFTVGLRVTDEFGESDTDTAQVMVDNVAPVLSLSGDASVDEGSLYTLNLSAVTDPGDDTISACTVDWGDGDSESCLGAIDGSLTHTYADGPNSYTIAVDLTDEDGAYDDVDTLPVTVANVAPTLTLSGDASVDEGSPYTLNLSAVTDPGDDAISACTVDWGDGDSESCLGAIDGSLTHTYADGPNGYTVAVDLADEDGTYDDVDTLDVTVNNVAPVVTVDIDSQTVQYSDSICDVTFTATDVLADPLTPSWSALPDSLAVTANGCTNDGLWQECSWTLSGTMDEPEGSYTIGVTVTDDDGGTGSAETTIVVEEEATGIVVDDASVQYSDSVELSATLTDDDGTPLPGKILSFDVPGACSGSATTNAEGVATYLCGPVSLLAGDYAIDVSYGGEAGYYEATSGAGTLTVVEEATQLTVDDLSVQYSDSVELSATLTDDDGTPLAGRSVVFVTDACSGSATTATDGLATFLCGPVSLPAGDYDIDVSYGGEAGYYEATSGAGTLTVEHEDARIRFHGGNPVAVRVLEAGGSSGLFDLMVRVREAYDPETDTEPTGEPWAFPGDISRAQVSMMLIPVGPGGDASPVGCVLSVADTGYDAKQTVVCSFDGVPVNTYVVQVTVDGDYYAGNGEDVLVVYDPSLGFTTGGGSFFWPGTGETTSFGFTMEYNKKGKNVKGSMLLIRHVSEDSRYQVKSNALYGLALGEDPSVPFGWASFSGKSTYLEPGWPDPIGNHEFIVYVEDRNEPGTGVDRFWIEVYDKDGNVIDVMSMDRPTDGHTETLGGGNIVVPH
jgi:hypothetical protein